MPLPYDQKLIDLSEALIAKLDTIFGLHPGFSPAHARGILLTGSFKPTADAAALSSAPHFAHASTSVTVRFSSSTGLPLVPDTKPNANPRGFAVRFNLGERIHTDIIGHSTPAFPTRTGEEFLEFLQALGTSAEREVSLTPIETFLGSHPAALAFVHTPKPSPTSFAREAYFGLHAMKFINSEGTVRYGRYSVVPDAGVEHLDEAAVKAKPEHFLFDELHQRIAHGPITFQLYVQLANDGDVVDDVTVHWPEDRPRINLGKLTLTAIADNNDDAQQRIIFDPIPRVQGIEPSDDPLLEFRAAVYLISGRRRRVAVREA
jgi:catalase